MGWLEALLAILVTLVLIVTEITNAGLRSWWGAHSMTTDTVSGLLVLLITVLVVNQLLNQRQARQRSHAIAAQTGIMVAQAAQTTKALLSKSEGSENRHAQFRTYMIMLLISSPVFIDDRGGRRFLEQAQVLSAVMARYLEHMNKSTDGAAVPSDRLNDAMQQLQSAAAPLLHELSPDVRDSIQGIGQAAEE